MVLYFSLSTMLVPRMRWIWILSCPSVQDSSIGDLVTESEWVSESLLILVSSEHYINYNNTNDNNVYNGYNDHNDHNAHNDYNDYNDYNNYNDYRDSGLDLDLDWKQFCELVT